MSNKNENINKGNRLVKGFVKSGEVKFHYWIAETNPSGSYCRIVKKYYDKKSKSHKTKIVRNEFTERILEYIRSLKFGQEYRNDMYMYFPLSSDREIVVAEWKNDFAVSICHPRDGFSRTLGREIAAGRLLAIIRKKIMLWFHKRFKCL